MLFGCTDGVSNSIWNYSPYENASAKVKSMLGLTEECTQIHYVYPSINV